MIQNPCIGGGARSNPAGPVRTPEIWSKVLNKSSECHAVFPDGKVLAPASFFGCHISLNSTSLAFVNSPFDASYDHERVEVTFLRRATEILMPAGIVAFISPEKQADEYTDVREFFKEWYTDLQTVPFPPDARPFNEVVVFGVKRKQPVSHYSVKWEEIQAPPVISTTSHPGPVRKHSRRVSQRSPNCELRCPPRRSGCACKRRRPGSSADHHCQFPKVTRFCCSLPEIWMVLCSRKASRRTSCAARRESETSYKAARPPRTRTAPKPPGRSSVRRSASWCARSGLMESFARSTTLPKEMDNHPSKNPTRSLERGAACSRAAEKLRES
jgi:hypothetical protein